jgi:hypothetical protein
VGCHTVTLGVAAGLTVPLQSVSGSVSRNEHPANKFGFARWYWPPPDSGAQRAPVLAQAGAPCVAFGVQCLHVAL